MTPPVGYSEAIDAYRAGDLRRATSLLEQCSREAPDHAPTAFGLGLCHEGRGEQSAALRAYETAARLEPGHANAHVRIGGLLEQSGDLTAALAAFRTALAVRPDPALAARVARLESSRQAPAEPTSVGARATSLADLLDAEGGSGEEIGGAVLASGHRNAASYRSLWVGVALVLVLPLVPLAIRLLRAALPPVPSAVHRAVATAVEVLWVAQLGLLAAALLLVGVALLRGRATTYVVRERRFEVTEGVLVRRHRLVWVYEVNDLTYRQTLLERLAASASLVLSVDDTRNPTVTLAGFGRADALRDLVTALQPVVLHERRAMKKQFL